MNEQGRYWHAKQHKRARRKMRKIKMFLVQLMRDIGRKVAVNQALEDVFRRRLWLAKRVMTQQR
jgi:hypothetical protein